MSADRLPRNLRRRARAQALTVPDRRQCTYCDKKAIRSDGCCNEHTTVEHAIPARFDERYDPSPEPIDRSIQ